MPKRILLLTFLFSCFFDISASAQNVVKGTVVDKHGNVIPNAEIQVKGTNVIKETNLNGTFNFSTEKKPKKITFRSIGKKTITKRYHEGMKVKMKPLTWKNETPQKWNYFIGAEALIGPNSMTPVGLRFGMAKKFGFYAHFAMTSVPDNIGKISDGYVVTSGKYKTSTTIMGVGGIVRLGCPLYFYAGATYRNDRVFVEHLESDWSYVSDGYVEISDKVYPFNNNGSWEDKLNAWNDIRPEVGLMFNYRQFYFNAGITSSLGLEDGFAFDDGDVMILIGAGIKL